MGLQTPLYNTIYGTILAGGTLSSEFNLQGYQLSGLIARSNSVNGTLGFMVSDLPDVPSRPGAAAGVYRTLYNNAGAAIAITAPSGQWGISSEYMLPLVGYQYVRVSSTAQTTGLALTLILKAD
jgi:hypothetical protein